MAAKASITHDPEMKAYYERRAALGKHHMAILNEVKFKLILRMFAVVNKGEVYVEKPTISSMIVWSILKLRIRICDTICIEGLNLLDV